MFPTSVSCTDMHVYTIIKLCGNSYVHLITCVSPFQQFASQVWEMVGDKINKGSSQNMSRPLSGCQRSFAGGRLYDGWITLQIHVYEDCAYRIFYSKAINYTIDC